MRSEKEYSTESDDLKTVRQVLRCDVCNQRRDSRVEVCRNCGKDAASVDPDMQPGPGVNYLTDDVRDITELDIPLSLTLLLERQVALAQEREILDGAKNP